MPGLNRNKQTVCETIGHKLQRKTLDNTRRDVQESYTCPSCTNLSTRSRAEMNYQIFHKILKQLLGLFIKRKYVTKTFTAFTCCENISGRNMDYREVQELKLLVLQS